MCLFMYSITDINIIFQKCIYMGQALHLFHTKSFLSRDCKYGQLDYLKQYGYS